MIVLILNDQLAVQAVLTQSHSCTLWKFTMRKSTQYQPNKIEAGFFYRRSRVADEKYEVVPVKSGVGSSSVGKKVNGQREEQKEKECKSTNSNVSVSTKLEVCEEVIEDIESAKNVEDIVNRLEELQLHGKEPELTEEELKVNDQLQEDELLSMESIYGDNVFIFNRQRGLRSFQIHIHIEAHGDLTVSANLNSFGDLRDKSDGSDEFSYSFKVQYLPPIVLSCILPNSYPSHLPPYFTISIQWLDSVRISNLCSMLDSLWREQPGQEVIYHWVEWLHDSSFSYLGFDNEIVLDPHGTTRCTEDKRVLSASVSPDVDIPLMKSYNDEKCHENFLQNMHECCICFSEYTGTDFIKLPCQHFFCKKCMKTFSDIHVKEATVHKLLCPDAKCGGKVPPGLLKQLLSGEEFERWESLTFEKTLESMSDVTYCPRCEAICVEDGDQHAQCPKCLFSFCFLCREQRHVGSECTSPEIKLEMLQDQTKLSRAMLDELCSLRKILSMSKQCPSCKIAISRTGGCNKMVCRNCGVYFCYQCNKEISGYGHFGSGSCKLFPDGAFENAFRNWEQRVNALREAGQRYGRHVGPPKHRCPNCPRMNEKVGNNNFIFCSGCEKRYCYLCKKIVRQINQHYGPNGCTQHTVG